MIVNQPERESQTERVREREIEREINPHVVNLLLSNVNLCTAAEQIDNWYESLNWQLQTVQY